MKGGRTDEGGKVEEELGDDCIGGFGIAAEEGGGDDGALEANELVLRVEEPAGGQDVHLKSAVRVALLEERRVRRVRLSQEERDPVVAVCGGVDQRAPKYDPPQGLTRNHVPDQDEDVLQSIVP